MKFVNDGDRAEREFWALEDGMDGFPLPHLEMILATVAILHSI